VGHVRRGPSTQLPDILRYTPDGFLYGARRTSPKVTDNIKGYNPSGVQSTLSNGSPVSPTNLPPQLSRKMLTIYGTDDRKEITYKAAYPYSTMGQLFFKNSTNSSFICSGAMMAEGALMTAAHCVYNRDASTWQNSWKFAAQQYVYNKTTYRVSGQENEFCVPTT
jgi:V8-like Glu-specific endopeptidase